MSRRIDWLLAPLAVAVLTTIATIQVSQARSPIYDGATATPTPTATSAAAQPSGTVLAADNFSDPSAGILQKDTSGALAPDKIKRGYVNGEYQLAKTDPAFNSNVIAGVAGPFADTIIDVDVRLVGANFPNQWADITCRTSNQGMPNFSQYYLEIEPIGQAYFLQRVDAGTQVRLASQTGVASIQTGDATNHLELICNGSTITASINGTQVASVQDTNYQSGAIGLGVGVFNNSAFPTTVDARFANLVIKQP